jgi:integrase
MGQAKYPTGVRPVGSGIQIRFTWNKQRYEPIWPFPPNAKNIQAAERIRTDLKFRAKAGLLTDEYLAELFPNYSGIAVQNSDAVSYLFGHQAQTYLDTATVSENTRTHYKYLLSKHWMPHLATVDVRDITPSLLRKIIAEKVWTSSRLKNIALTSLRNVLNMCVEDLIIDKSPMIAIKNAKLVVEEIDPFTAEEREILLNYMDKEFRGKKRLYYLYFKFAFWTGMRPSEIIAIQWGNVDFITNRVLINRSTVRGKSKNTTKTNKARSVILNDEALSVLKELKAYSFLQGEEVFVSPRHGQSFKGSSSGRSVLTHVCARTGVRHRPSYNTRHTYATFCLMAGVNPAFIAKQLGHSIKTLFNNYAKWIEGDADALEMAKIGKELGKTKSA